VAHYYCIVDDGDELLLPIKKTALYVAACGIDEAFVMKRAHE
jgi:hypothetical protein